MARRSPTRRDARAGRRRRGAGSTRCRGLGLPDERIDGQVVDLLDDGRDTRLGRRASARFGGVDGLVHLVGGWRGGKPIAEADLEDWRLLHDLLFRTVQHATRAFAPRAARRARGRFALVSRRAGASAPTRTQRRLRGGQGRRRGVDARARRRARRDGGTANIVVVNAIVTPQMRAENPDKAYRRSPTPSEIADALVFLCSDAARKMNGQRLALHG